MQAYWDTSALAKVYVRESGSARAIALHQSHAVISSALLPLELSSLIERQRRDRLIEAGEARRVSALFHTHRRDWTLIAVSADVLERGERLVALSPLRTLDAIHLASALLVASQQPVPLPFVTADRRQADTAGKLGLALEWVE